MSLIGWWPLHEQSGPTAYDLSGNDYHGTTTGGPTQGVAGTHGLTGYSFDGSDDRIDLPNVLPDGIETCSVSMWVYLRNSTSSALYTKYGSGPSQGVGVNGSSELFFAIRTGTTRTLATTTDYSTGQWHHVVGVYNGSEMRLYVDGDLKNSASKTGTLNSEGTDQYIGARSGSYSNAVISDVRIYDRPLTSLEVQQLYTRGSGDYANPPDGSDGGVAYYPLDSDALDSWGSNDGTVNGASTTTDAIRGQAYSFNGSGDYISLMPGTGAYFSQFTSYTLSAWVKFNSASNTADYISLRENNGIVVRGNTGTFEFIQNGSSGWKSFTGPTYTTGEWYHVAATWDSSVLRGFVNGASVGSVAVGNMNGNANGDSIGGLAGKSKNWLDGKMDDFRIYDRALEPWEIHELYRWGTKGHDLRKLTVNAK